MRRLIASSALLFAAYAAAPAVAGPQWQEYGPGSDVIRCESNDGRVRECPTGGGQVMLERQISRAACIEGRSWGYGRNGIWVSQGCRADFRLTDVHHGNGGYYGSNNYGDATYGNGNYGDPYGNGNGNSYSQGQSIRCESNDGRTQRCALNTNPRDVQLMRQLSRSACIEGRSWGRDRGGVWVSDGCRADFSVSASRYANGNGDHHGRQHSGYGNLIRCESHDGRTRECAANTRAGVQLVRQLSSTACMQGRTWGYGRNGIWVSQGCRGDFRSF